MLGRSGVLASGLNCVGRGHAPAGVSAISKRSDGQRAHLLMLRFAEARR
jgi:hypothetical protein